MNLLDLALKESKLYEGRYQKQLELNADLWDQIRRLQTRVATLEEVQLSVRGERIESNLRRGSGRAGTDENLSNRM